jgi:hypothetical protein
MVLRGTCHCIVDETVKNQDWVVTLTPILVTVTSTSIALALITAVERPVKGVQRCAQIPVCSSLWLTLLFLNIPTGSPYPVQDLLKVMTEPRRSTVFDYSNLLLHPDGTRVYQKSTNLAPRIAKVAVRTSRNTWIARDAGGLSNIRKYKSNKRTLQDLQADEEFIDLRTTGTAESSPKPEEERKTKRFDGRTAKRRRFLEDYDYLDKNRSTSTNLALDTGTESFPYEPSSVRPSFLQYLHILVLIT